MTTDFGLKQLDIDPEARSALRAFVRAWKDHAKPVLFAGAGLSFNAKRKPRAPVSSNFASWSEIIEALREELSNDDKTLRARLPQDPLRLAQIYESPARRGLLLDRIAERVPSADFVPGAVHQKLARLPWAAIVTTNYDDLIERAFAGARSVLRIIWDIDLTQRRAPDDLLVIKMHGDLTSRESIVITEEDYRLYESKRPGLAVKIKQLLLEHPLMFVGFSLTDPNFGAIDGWIRDTVGAVRLPAVAIMHGPAIPSESHMWKARGIEVVRLADSRPLQLERLFDALKGERASLSGGRQPRLPNERMNELRQRLRQVLSSRQERDTWPVDVASLMAEAIVGAPRDPDGGEDAKRLVTSFCHGYLDDVDGRPDLSLVYEALLRSHRRTFLLFAHDTGQISFTPDGRTHIDLSPEILSDDTLSPDERARVHLARGVVLRNQGSFKEAMDDLAIARQSADSDDLRVQISEEIHETLFLRGDPEQIESEFKSADYDGDAFALCRRGSRALLLGEPEKAEGWYKSALEHAISGDEQYVALWGLRVARARYSPLDFADDEGRRRELAEISEDDRPLNTKIFALLDEAGQKLLDGNLVGAISVLKDYLRESRRLGWPHSISHSISFPMEIAAGQAVALLMSTDSDGDEPSTSEIREGLALLTQFGLARRVKSVFNSRTLSQLSSNSADSAWFREFVGATGGIPRTQDARHSLAIAGIPLLDDESICREVSKLSEETIKFIADRSAGTVTVLSSTLDDRWNSVVAHDEHLPHRAVEDVVKVLEQAIPDGYVCSTMGVKRLVWNLWQEGGFVTPASPSIRRVISSIVEHVMARDRVHDPFWAIEVSGVVQSLRFADLLDHEHKILLRPALVSLLEQTLATPERFVNYFPMADLLIFLDPTSHFLEEISKRMLSSYEDLVTTSQRPDWIDLAARMVGHFSTTQLTRVQQIATDYAGECLLPAETRRDWLCQPQVAADLLMALEKRRGDLSIADKTLNTLLALGRRDGRAFATIANSAVVPEEALCAAEDEIGETLARSLDI